MAWLKQYTLYLKAGAAVALLVGCAWVGWEWRDRSADVAVAEARADANKKIAEAAAAEAVAVKRAQAAERAMAADHGAADTEATTRNEKIESDHQRRIAGLNGERARLQDRWAACETNRLAEGAGAAAAAQEQDRLRSESLSRVLRDVSLAQSERDEVIDRYEAVRRAVNAGP